MNEYTHPSHGYLYVEPKADPAKSSVESPKGWLALAASICHDPFKQASKEVNNQPGHAGLFIEEVKVSRD